MSVEETDRAKLLSELLVGLARSSSALLLEVRKQGELVKRLTLETAMRLGDSDPEHELMRSLGVQWKLLESQTNIEWMKLNMALKAARGDGGDKVPGQTQKGNTGVN